MIASHAHRFVFLKTRKTAGTSIEIALSRHLGPDDVVTRIGAKDEATRTATGGRGPQHDRTPLRRYRPADLDRLRRTRRPLRAYNHMSAAETRRWLGRPTWDAYRKFAVVRNPWDAAVSHYFWKTRDLPDADRPTLQQFVAGPALEPLTRNWSVITIDDRIVVDDVCRYEDLADDLGEVTRQLGLPPLDLPRAKGGTRTDTRPAAELLGADGVDTVRARFRHEIDAFGYRP